MTIFQMRLFLIAMSLMLTIILARKSEAQENPAAYLKVITSIRAAKAKIAANNGDIFLLVQIYQGEEYAKALREASELNDDAALLELYQAKYGEQWPRTVKGTPLLSYAAINHDVHAVQRLIQRGIDVKATNAEGWTALHCGAEAGDVVIVKALLDRGADVNAKTERFDETPLMMACGIHGGGRNSIDCVKALLKPRKMSDRPFETLNAQTQDDETALMFAASRGRIDIVKYLLSKKADAEIEDYKGKTALSRVDDFLRIDKNGEITYMQDSVTIPTFKLKVGEALIRHGKMSPGRYMSDEIEREYQNEALKDFLDIAKLLQKAERLAVPARKEKLGTADEAILN